MNNSSNVLQNAFKYDQARVRTLETEGDGGEVYNNDKDDIDDQNDQQAVSPHFQEPLKSS